MVKNIKKSNWWNTRWSLIKQLKKILDELLCFQFIFLYLDLISRSRARVRWSLNGILLRSRNLDLYFVLLGLESSSILSKRHLKMKRVGDTLNSVAKWQKFRQECTMHSIRSIPLLKPHGYLDLNAGISFPMFPMMWDFKNEESSRVELKRKKIASKSRSRFRSRSRF